MKLYQVNIESGNNETTITGEGQIKGPFKKGYQIKIKPSENTMYVHIGFQIPFSAAQRTILGEEEFCNIEMTYNGFERKKRPENNRDVVFKEIPGYEPLSNYIPDEDYDFMIKSSKKVVNGYSAPKIAQTFKISERNILEFDCLADRDWTIIFNKNLPRESIIDIACR